MNHIKSTAGTTKNMNDGHSRRSLFSLLEFLLLGSLIHYLLKGQAIQSPDYYSKPELTIANLCVVKNFQISYSYSDNTFICHVTQSWIQKGAIIK